MNNMMTGNAMANATPQPQMNNYGQGTNPRMGMGLGGFGNFGGFGGSSGMPFNVSGFGGMNAGLGSFGGFGGFNPMMGYGGFGGFGGFNPMMGYGGFGGFGGFNPMMGYGGFGGFGGFNPMMGGYGDGFAQQQGQPNFQPQMAQQYNPNVYNPRENALREMQQRFQQRESSMTDYQKLMERQRMANMPRPPSPPSMPGGLGQMPVTAPSDLEIANSLGYKDPYAGRDMLTWARLPDDPNVVKEAQERSAKAKEYLNSIGYGQSGFDASKYEVKRQPVSTGPRTGLGALLGG